MRDKIDQPSWNGNVTTYPELYDLLHSDTNGDVLLYQRLSAGCDSVLECGVGTGRIAIPLARQGKIVYGIDKSPEMLGALREKLKGEPNAVRDRLHIYEANMCSFDLGVSFKFAYVPFMTFNYLPDIRSQLACLRSIHAHLEKAGTLVLELISFYREWFHNDGIARFVAEKTDSDTGKRIRVFRVTRFDPSTQVLEHERHYYFLDPMGRVEDEQIVLLRNRFFFLGEASLLLKKSSFTLEHVWGDHKGGPYTSESQVMILVASKAIGQSRSHKDARVKKVKHNEYTN
ncbi:MAG TPA: class I SAM-dependent methyltransferase [Pyrinomonadaceae bacterium]|nr:class I SAM-dependent methyltransferase [Pyrinomonadaceae bacterium]